MDTQASLLLLLSVLSHLHLYQTLAVCQQYGCSLECSDLGVHFEIHGSGLLLVMGIRSVTNEILRFLESSFRLLAVEIVLEIGVAWSWKVFFHLPFYLSMFIGQFRSPDRRPKLSA
jgi:hypothetical protein